MTLVSDAPPPQYTACTHGLATQACHTEFRVQSQMYNPLIGEKTTKGSNGSADTGKLSCESEKLPQKKLPVIL